jgi:hypothetical protein
VIEKGNYMGCITKVNHLLIAASGVNCSFDVVLNFVFKMIFSVSAPNCAVPKIKK